MEIRSPDRAGLVAPTPRGGRARRGVLATRRGAASGPFLAASRESASSAVAATSPRRRRAFPGLSRRLARGQVFAADLAASLPGFNYSALPGEKFDAWLKRLPLVEGLAFELFIRMGEPKGRDYRKGIQTIGAFAEVSRGARIGADAAPSSEGRPIRRRIGAGLRTPPPPRGGRPATPPPRRRRGDESGASRERSIRAQASACASRTS